jgi:hypothetical protein
MLSSPGPRASSVDQDAGPDIRFRELFEQCPISIQILALVNEVRDIPQTHQAVVSVSEGKSWTQAINAASLSDKYAAYRSYATRTDGTAQRGEIHAADGRIAVRVAREGEVTANSNGLGTGSVFTVTLKAAGPSVQDV